MSKLHFKGRIAISGPAAMGPDGELSQYKIGGALIALKDMPVVKGQNWEMIECDVIIIPTKIHRTIKDSMKSARLDQVALTVGKDGYWSDTELPNDSKDVIDELMS